TSVCNKPNTPFLLGASSPSCRHTSCDKLPLIRIILTPVWTWRGIECDRRAMRCVCGFRKVFVAKTMPRSDQRPSCHYHNKKACSRDFSTRTISVLSLFLYELCGPPDKPISKTPPDNPDQVSIHRCTPFGAVGL
ncbi:unnamed protein product, partial [Ectocarpus fasciculatus]